MNPNWIGIFLFIALTANAAAQSSASDFDLLARKCAPWVAKETLAALVKRESDFNPYAIGINGGNRLERQPRSKDEAVKKTRWLVANGYSVDLGLGQISAANRNTLGLSIEDAFDPCRNLSVGAGILQDNYLRARAKFNDEQTALRAALSAYNTGSFSLGVLNGYVGKVVRVAIKNAALSKKAIAPTPAEENGYNVRTVV